MQESLRTIIFIGPDKCGSTWFFQCISSSSEVADSKVKDPFYFDRNYKLGRSWYDSLYTFGQDSTVRLDVSHDYLFDAVAAQRIARDLPRETTSLVLGARDPIERAASSFHYMKSQGRLDVDVPFLAALKDVDELIDHGDYGSNLGPWIDTGMQVSVLDFGSLRRDPAATLRHLCGELHLNPELIRRDPAELVNVARRARSTSLVRVLRAVSAGLRQRGASRIVQRSKDSALLQACIFDRGEAITRVSQSEIVEARRRYSDRIHSSLISAQELIYSPAWEHILAPYR